MHWQDLERVGGKKITPRNGCDLYLFEIPPEDPKSKRTAWLIGQYNTLAALATDLRNDAGLRELLTHYGVRLGLRRTDVPPANIEPQKSFGPLVQGANYDQDFTKMREKRLALPIRDTSPTPPNRRDDREENVKRYWESLTPQSHHIVEFKNLETLGVSHRPGLGKMDYDQLPAMLLAAEFHKCYICPLLKPAQLWGKEQLQKDMKTLYSNLYLHKSDLFKSLWPIAEVIMKNAGL